MSSTEDSRAEAQQRRAREKQIRISYQLPVSRGLWFLSFLPLPKAGS